MVSSIHTGRTLVDNERKLDRRLARPSRPSPPPPPPPATYPRPSAPSELLPAAEIPATDQDSPTTSPSEVPSASPKPSEIPTNRPSISCAPSISWEPTLDPTPEPSLSSKPTSKPTSSPTPAPTTEPTKEPTAAPTPAPTKAPTKVPTKSPTPVPSPNPTPSPTKEVGLSASETTMPPTPVCPVGRGYCDIYPGSRVKCGSLDCVYDNFCLATNAGFDVPRDCCLAPLASVCPAIFEPVSCGDTRCEYDNMCLAVKAGFVESQCSSSCPSGSGDCSFAPSNPVKCGPNSGYSCVYDSLCLANNAGWSLPSHCCQAPPASACLARSYAHRFEPVTCGDTNCPFDSPCLAEAAGYQPGQCAAARVTATESPTPAPTSEPTRSPTPAPTPAPTPSPTQVPTLRPSVSPSQAPSVPNIFWVKCSGSQGSLSSIVRPVPNSRTYTVEVTAHCNTLTNPFIADQFQDTTPEEWVVGTSDLQCKADTIEGCRVENYSVICTVNIAPQNTGGGGSCTEPTVSAIVNVLCC